MKIPIVDDRLNKITMYRITLYYLIFLVASAVILAFLGFLNYSPIDIMIDAIAVVAICWVANYIFAWIFNAVTNFESVFITALILLLIVPTKFPHDFLFLLFAGVGAMAIKYLPTIDKRHIFNPAAGSVAAIALISAEHSATWWVGTQVMFPFVFLGGLFIVRKIRREGMVAVFLATYLILVGIFSLIHNLSIPDLLRTFQVSIFSSAVIFFAFIMLVEPLTSPATKRLQYYYAALVALLYATPQMRLFGFALTPELALGAGNIFSYIVSPKYRLLLKLKEKINIASNTMLFNFGKVDKFAFVPGQYLEWTLPHPKMDSRGNRRYFSIASGLNEDLKIAVRFHDKPSSYKQAMQNMNVGDEIVAASLAGDFVMPDNPSTPVVFMAGGIGIAPFRSIIEDATDKNLKINAVLMYSNRAYSEISFSDLFQRAIPNGVRTVYTLTDPANVPQSWGREIGHFTPEMVKKYVPDYQNRVFYISGPAPMVQSTESMLKSIPIPGNKIITDFFPGYEENS